MSRHTQGLAQRRRELVERSGAQRAAIAAAAAPIVRKVGAVDRVVGLVRRYPIVSSMVIGAVALFGPRKIYDLGARAVTLYLLLRR